MFAQNCQEMTLLSAMAQPPMSFADTP